MGAGQPMGQHNEYILKEFLSMSGEKIADPVVQAVLR